MASTMTTTTYTGQIEQDRIVLEHLGWKRDGYFVEIGAFHGENISNTFVLESRFGWQGLAIEPFPQGGFDQRTRTRLVQVAIGKDDGHTVNFVRSQDRAFSGLQEFLNHSWGGDVVPVQTRTLTSVFKEYHVPNVIDYVSIDTEGSELMILQHFPFGTHRVCIWTIEHNYKEPARSQIRDLMLTNGYKRLRELQWDDVYVPI